MFQIVVVVLLVEYVNNLLQSLADREVQYEPQFGEIQSTAWVCFVLFDFYCVCFCELRPRIEMIIRIVGHMFTFRQLVLRPDYTIIKSFEEVYPKWSFIEPIAELAAHSGVLEHLTHALLEAEVEETGR